VDEILIVLGHRSGAIAPTLSELGVRVVVNDAYREGMLSSVRAGVHAADPDAEWLLLALGDQPTLRPETVERLLAEAEAGDAGLVVPSYERRRGHPLLIHRRYREEIDALSGETGLRELFQRHPQAIRHVEVESQTVLQDMDTPEEYRRTLEALEDELAG